MNYFIEIIIQCLKKKETRISNTKKYIRNTSKNNITTFCMFKLLFFYLSQVCVLHKIAQILSHVKPNIPSNQHDEVQTDDALQSGAAVHDVRLARHEVQQLQSHETGNLGHQIARQRHLLLDDRIENGHQAIDRERFRTQLGGHFLRHDLLGPDRLLGLALFAVVLDEQSLVQPDIVVAGEERGDQQVFGVVGELQLLMGNGRNSRLIAIV